MAATQLSIPPKYMSSTAPRPERPYLDGGRVQHDPNGGTEGLGRQVVSELRADNAGVA